MNYQAHYDRLIQRSQAREPEGHIERHHIIPRCLGGSDFRTNFVKLYPEEHYVAHQLLVKMYPNNYKLVHAAQLMTTDSCGNRVNNKLYGWLRRRVREASLGENNPRYGKPGVNLGKHLTKETIQKLSQSWDVERKLENAKRCKLLHDQWKILPQCGESNRMFNKKHKPEVIAKMSEDRKGTKNNFYGRKHTAAVVLKLTGKNNYMFGRTGELNPMFGQKHTKESLDKIRNSWTPERIKAQRQITSQMNARRKMETQNTVKRKAHLLASVPQDIIS